MIGKIVEYLIESKKKMSCQRFFFQLLIRSDKAINLIRVRGIQIRPTLTS